MTICSNVCSNGKAVARRVVIAFAIGGLAVTDMPASAQVVYQPLADLSTIQASNAQGTLIVGQDGALYGTAQNGGVFALDCGVVYRLELSGALAGIHSFREWDGCGPIGDLVRGPDGTLYGTTSGGGAFGAGTVFRMTVDGTVTVVHHFQAGALGLSPRGGVAFGADGYLYGTTMPNGQNGDGTAFRIHPSGVGFTILGLVGTPDAGLRRGADGLLYGSNRGTATSVGSFFRVNPAIGVELLYTLPFTPQPFPLPGLAPEGVAPMGELIEGPAGVFYGTAREGPPESDAGGTVFRLEPNGSAWALTLLHTFPPPENNLSPLGRNPEAGLTLGADGSLYGTTIAGGTYGNGTIFRVSPAGTFAVLHSFDFAAGAASNNARLLEISPGVFIGATQSGIFRAVVSTGNSAPIATDMAVSINEDTTASGTLPATDPNGDPLTYSLLVNGALGTAVITDASSGAFSYTPTLDANGIDTFTFRVNDGLADSNVATVTLTITPVNDAPVAAAGTLDVVEDVPRAGQLVATDVDSATLTYAVVTAPSLGAVVLDAATGAYTYTPNPNANGADSFAFQASDGQAVAASALVTVAIAAVSDATATTLAVSPNPSVFGAPVTLTATVTSSAGTPTGAVEFLLGTTTIGYANISGSATWTTPSLPSGALSLRARFGSSGDYAPSESEVVLHDSTQDSRLVRQLPFAAVGRPRTLSVDDFNDDGRLDLAIPGLPNADVKVSFGDGSGGFAAPQTVEVVGLSPELLATGDFNGDGARDIVAGDYDRIALILGNGDGTFSPVPFGTLPGALRSIAAGDIDADGLTDVVASYLRSNSAYVAVLFGQSDGTLGAAVEYPGGIGDVAIADVNGDGVVDVVAVAGERSEIQVLLGNSDGTLRLDAALPAPFASGAVSAADVNGDATVDLLVLRRVPSGPGQTEHSAVNVLLGLGDGVFASPVSYPVTSAVSLTVTDLDQDLAPDVVVAGERTISALRGVGDGTFHAPSAYLLGQAPYLPWPSAGPAQGNGIAAGDFNGDTAIDVVAGRVGENTVTVFLNSGGTVLQTTAVPASLQPGEPVVLTTTVSPTVAAGSPGGTVTFLDGATPLGTVPVSGGSAVLTVTTLTSGLHTIVGRYDGDAVFNPRTSAPIAVAVVAAPLTVAVLTPNGGERVFANVPVTIRWTAGGSPTTFDVELSRSGGSTFAPIPGCMGLAGTASSCAWTPAAPAGTTLRVRVTARAASGAVSDLSDADFTLSTATPTLTVTAPNSAVSWRIGTTQNLRWNHNLGLGSLVRVELSRDAGATWEVINASFANTAVTSSLLAWTVNGPATTAASLRVTWLDGNGVSDVSNIPFAIARPTLAVTAPNTAVTWSIGSSRAITWTHNLPAGETVDLDVSRDGGATWAVIATGIAGPAATTGNFNWVVTGPESTMARIRVRWSADALANDASNVDFSVVAPVVTLTTPNTAVTWRVGNSQTLRATHNLGAGQPVAFDVSVDDGVTWTELSQVTTGASSAVTYPWTVALPTASNARVRARWVASPAVADASDVPFRIIPRITVTAPNTAVTWGAGSTRTITWTHNLGTSEPVDIAFSTDGGTSWTTVASAVANATATTGTTSVVLPDTPTSTGLVRVSQTSNPAHFDVADVFLTLVPPVITVNSPNTNVNWTIGSTRNITWSHNLGGLERVTIELSRDGGATWTPLAAAVLNSGNASGSWSWNPVSGPATLAARTRVTWDRNGTVQDVGNVNFRIQ